MVEAETPAPLPAHGLGDAALFTFDDFPQARSTMCYGMVAHFDSDITAAHLVGNSSSRAGAKEAI